MESVTRLILPDVSEALRSDPSSVVEMTEELHSADLADLAAKLEPDLALRLLLALPVEQSSRLIEALERDKRVELFAQLCNQDLATAVSIAEGMAPDERADLFGELAEEMRAALLGRMEHAESRDVRQLLAHPEGTAGALMTTNFVALPADITVAHAIENVRKSAEEMETIYDAYAVDPHGTLLGTVSLRQLVLAPADKTIADVMEPNVIAVDVEADQEEVARVIAKYDFLALPVIDRSRRIVGIVTVDDVVDVLEEEATEDVQRLGAVEPLEHAYFQTGFWEFVRKRSSWLVVLFLGELATGSAMHHYTATFEQFASLVWFVPLIISSGGNAGSQSASIMIRALAVGEVRPRDFARVIGRELGIGLALGITLSVFGMGRVFLWEATRTMAMAWTISLSIVTVVVLGAVFGAGFPLLLRRVGVDPAVSSTPFVASFVDVLGLMVYFEIARVLLF
ncbi:MAG: magnesium transporter [Deltaproteobacteria bacterium]|nr:magnesium transporter [Deltaproteobacteria bacterium]